MRRNENRSKVGWVALAALMMGGLLLSPSIASAQTKTAQSAMFDNQAAGNFVIVGSESWAFDADVAATYFMGSLVSGPVATCTGASSNTGRGCNSVYQPAAPSSPDPSPVPNSNVNGTVNPQNCTFWDGGQLQVNAPHATYTKSVNNVPGLTPTTGNAGNWKFEWTYSYSVVGNGLVAAKTAWILQSSNTNGASVSVTGFFAGQSVQSKTNGTGGWSFKASHTMLDSLGASRLVGATATITDSDANTVCTLALSTGILSNQDFTYLGNAGRNGTTAQLFDDGVNTNGTVNEIQGGVSTSLNGKKDDFAGNNGTGGDQAVINGSTPSSCLISDAGDYTLNVTGTLKGVSGSSSLPVGVSSSVCISAGTCSVCQ